MARSIYDAGVVLKGDEELERKLKALPDDLMRKVISGATSRAMTPVQKAARNKVPVRHRLLKDSIGKKSKLYKRTMSAVTIVGPRTGFKKKVRSAGDASLKDAWNSGDPAKAIYADPVKYAHLVEFGTGPHIIRSRSGGAMGAGGRFGKVVHHPGTKAQPFMRPAMQNHEPQVLSIYRAELRRGLVKIEKKMAKR